MNQRANTRGEVAECLPNTQFRVQIGDKLVRCVISGRMRVNKIRIAIGDTVDVYLPPGSDFGRITRRL